MSALWGERPEVSGARSKVTRLIQIGHSAPPVLDLRPIASTHQICSFMFGAVRRVMLGQRCNPGPTSAEEDEYDQPSCSALELSAASPPIAAASRRPANGGRWQPVFFVHRLW